MDRWNTARDPGYGMSYFTREDLPYYYSLYDAFAVGDQYFQSTFTCTNPNRMHLFTGSNGLSVGHDAVLENAEPRPGYDWITMAEVLQAKNVSWRVYQQLDNFDDNAFAWFASFQQSRPGSQLFDQGMARQVDAIEAFGEDIASGKLPQVSWVIAPTEKSEHATNHPAAGEDFTARLLQKLQANPEVYAKTAVVLNYDEGGQFYDHAWTPTPPMQGSEGVSSVTVDGEVNNNVLTTVPEPIGLGFRVPILVISPWTRGNIVISHVFDHTSVIKLLETRFEVTCPNISPWRRTVTGDLSIIFDFDHPDYTWPTLPDTSNYVKAADVECHTLPDPVIPTVQSMPMQEPGTRISRALPYEFIVNGHTVDSSNGASFVLSINNTGASGAPLVVFDQLKIATANPRPYAVEAGKVITDTLVISKTTASGTAPYSFYLFGPNGFVRQFSGDASDATEAMADMHYSVATSSITITIKNQDKNNAREFIITDNAYGLIAEAVVLKVEADSSIDWSVSTGASGNWYDFTVTESAASTSQSTVRSSDAPYVRRFMGRMETGKDTISDPAMAHAFPGLWRTNTVHATLPASVRESPRRISKAYVSKDKDAVLRWTPVDV
jgi:phospholipase C